MLRAFAKNNSAHNEFRMFNIINTTNNNENSLFSIIDKAIHNKKDEELVEEVVSVEKKSNAGLFLAIAGAVIVALTAVAWLSFTAFKLAGGRLPWEWEPDHDTCCCDELEYEEEV